MKKKSFFIAFTVFAALLFSTVQGQEYKKELFISGEDTLLLRVMYPKNFDQETAYPLVLFLHGAGERGHDNAKQLVHGASFFADSIHREQFPAVVVFPQCNENDYWARIKTTTDAQGKRSFFFQPRLEPTKAMTLLLSYLDQLLLQKWVEQNRIYLGGLSMGGMGTFELLHRRPDVFAAAFPICGGGDPETTSSFAKKVPLWVFHGKEDAVVPVELSVNMIESLKNNGAEPRLTIYPEVNHNAWDYVFQEKELLPWLFSNRKL